MCWFKSSATAHIAKVWEMVFILEENGLYVQEFRTRQPGYIVYEDDYQVVAEPFADLEL